MHPNLLLVRRINDTTDRLTFNEGASGLACLEQFQQSLEAQGHTVETSDAVGNFSISPPLSPQTLRQALGECGISNYAYAHDSKKPTEQLVIYGHVLGELALAETKQLALVS